METSMAFRSVSIALICLSITMMITCARPRPDSAVETTLTGPWHIRASSEVESQGDVISSPGFDVEGWYPTNLPSTVLAALVRNGVYEDPYFGKNLENIPKEQFQKPWWYRTEFDFDGGDKIEHVRLVFEGINYRADVWLNGKQIAGSDSIVNAFRIYDLDITNAIRIGKNVLAVQVHPPESGDFTIGFVDWNPRPPDENMGIWRPVKLRWGGPVSIDQSFVQTQVNLETLDEASLTITANLTNHTDKAVSGTVKGKIGRIRFSRDYTLDPHETKRITFDPEQFALLNIRNPKLWWPNNLGEPNLYSLELTVETEKDISDTQNMRFGIRQVSDYFNDEGHRGYKVNGKKVQIRGGGWVDDLMLADDDRRVEAQVRYAKQMNLNTLRLEGFWGSSQKLYDAADENGILLMVGWSCHWEWTGYLGKQVGDFMGIETPEEIDLMSQSYIDQVLWLRNHPSIFVWVFGSDKLLRPTLEKKMVDQLAEADPTRPILGSCQRLNSSITGPTGVKMFGPYAYVTPNYWYLDKEHGGAYGFNTETGPGAQPPPLESIKKMIPEAHRWPINDHWNYHCARNEFATLDRYLNALNHRYGESENLEEFAVKAQMANYEAMRGMFEAFAVNKHNATGIIQWMYNSAWPAMYWQLFDWYLMPNGAFYGAQTACEPLNLVYNYGDRSIHLVNDRLRSAENMSAEIRVLDLDSRSLLEENLAVSAKVNTSHKIFELPSIERISPVYFLDLKLKNDSGNLIEENFYWLSTKEDMLDFENSLWFVTPIKEYGDFTALNSLSDVQLDVSHNFDLKDKESQIHVTLTNPSDKIAFFVELQVVGNRSGRTVLPVFWEDNYVSLLPGETKRLSATFATKDLNFEEPVFKYSGINVKMD